MQTTQRSQVVSQLTTTLDGIRSDHPLRVAINGRVASGKTTLAGELAHELEVLGRTVLHVGVDGFHNPSEVRYRQGRSSPRGYYEDAYDLDALRHVLLDPLGPDGDRRVRTAAFDLTRDEAVEGPLVEMEADSILLVDGSFLLLQPVRDAWDYVIFVDVDRTVATERGAARDAARLGGVEQARSLHEVRYQEACDLYRAEVDPLAIANAIVTNEPVDCPQLRLT